MSDGTTKEHLNWRYAVKAFDPALKLKPEQLQLFESALSLSPSSFGLQLWKFLNIEDPDLRKQLRAHAWNQSQVVDASHLFVFCRPLDCNRDDVERFMQQIVETRGVSRESLDGYFNVVVGFLDKFSKEERQHWMERQLYIALGSVLTVAASNQIDACPMEGFERDGISEVLGLKQKGLEPVVLCALGYRSSDDKYASLKKVRFDPAQTIETI